MALSLELTTPAENDFEAILEYTLDRHGAEQYYKYRDLILAACKSLTEDPGLLPGKPRNDIAEGVRFYPVGRHFIAYRCTADALIVLRILHQRMDLSAQLKAGEESGSS